VLFPALEYSEVLDVDSRKLDPHSVLRFVEPETGEVAALRPDMTPQVARLVTTRLAQAPMPARLCYQGSVLRRRRERARNNQQIPQAGIELVGVAGREGDLEVLEATIAAVRASGLTRFIVDLGHADIAPQLLHTVARERWPEILEALALKDQPCLARRAEAAGITGRDLAALVALPEMHGGAELWARAERVLADTTALAPMRELKALWQAAGDDGLDVNLSVDLGETWRFDYYTGPMFQLLAEGPGLPIGSGGRYDALYARFGVQHPAAGCALDLDNLEWACRHSGAEQHQPVRVLVSASASGARRVLNDLRALGVIAARAPEHEPLEYARAWGFSHVLEVSGKGASLTCVSDGSTLPVAAVASEIARQLPLKREA